MIALVDTKVNPLIKVNSQILELVVFLEVGACMKDKLTIKTKNREVVPIKYMVA